MAFFSAKSSREGSNKATLLARAEMATGMEMLADEEEVSRPSSGAEVVCVRFWKKTQVSYFKRVKKKKKKKKKD